MKECETRGKSACHWWSRPFQVTRPTANPYESPITAWTVVVVVGPHPPIDIRILVEPTVIVETAARKDALEKRKNTDKKRQTESRARRD
jgi:hypothetical protein